MLPIQLFNYPNGKYGIYIFKSGYQSTSSMFDVNYSSIADLRSTDSDKGKNILLFPVRDCWGPTKYLFEGMLEETKNIQNIVLMNLLKC